MACLLLMLGEWPLLGSLRALLALGLLCLGGLSATYTVAAYGRGSTARALGPAAFGGAVAVALLSSAVVPPGTAVPPPLWPAAVAAAAVVGLRRGASFGLAAGAVAGAIPVLSFAITATALTPELSAVQTALVLASVAPALVAGAVGPTAGLARPPARPQAGLAPPEISTPSGPEGA